MHIHSDISTLGALSQGLTLPSRTSTTSSAKNTPSAEEKTSKEKTALGKDTVQLTSVDRDLAQLQARDREVRAHEAAHAGAAGSVATGAPQFTFQRGPDGRLYAVAGEVSIDVSPVAGNPDATIRKAQTIRAAALAPANPSAQDRSVAAQANRMEAQARRDLQNERTEAVQDATHSADPSLIFSATASSSRPTPAHQIIDLFA